MRPDITVPHNESSGFFMVPPTWRSIYGTTGAGILDQFKSRRNVEQFGHLLAPSLPTADSTGSDSGSDSGSARTRPSLLEHILRVIDDQMRAHADGARKHVAQWHLRAASLKQQ